MLPANIISAIERSAEICDSRGRDYARLSREAQAVARRELWGYAEMRSLQWFEAADRLYKYLWKYNPQ